MNWMSMLPGLGQMGMNLFGGDQAGRHLDEGFNRASGYLNPFLKGGADAFGRYGKESQGLTGLRGPLMEQINRMMSNPGDLLKSIGQGYQQSPGYQFNVDEATKAMNAASQAGGMVGTPAHQQNIAQTVTGLANQDYNNYMNQALGLYGQGMGAGQNMYGMGFGGLGNMSQMGLNAGGMMGNWAMQNAQDRASQENARRSGMMGGLGSLLGGAAGFAMGGPMGGMIGSGLLRR